MISNNLPNSTTQGANTSKVPQQANIVFFDLNSENLINKITTIIYSDDKIEQSEKFKVINNFKICLASTQNTAQISNIKHKIYSILSVSANIDDKINVAQLFNGVACKIDECLKSQDYQPVVEQLQQIGQMCNQLISGQDISLSKKLQLISDNSNVVLSNIGVQKSEIVQGKLGSCILLSAFNAAFAVNSKIIDVSKNLGGDFVLSCHYSELTFTQTQEEQLIKYGYKFNKGFNDVITGLIVSPGLYKKILQNPHSKSKIADIDITVKILEDMFHQVKEDATVKSYELIISKITSLFGVKSISTKNEKFDLEHVFANYKNSENNMLILGLDNSVGHAILFVEYDPISQNITTLNPWGEEEMYHIRDFQERFKGYVNQVLVIGDKSEEDVLAELKLVSNSKKLPNSLTSPLTGISGLTVYIDGKESKEYEVGFSPFKGGRYIKFKGKPYSGELANKIWCEDGIISTTTGYTTQKSVLYHNSVRFFGEHEGNLYYNGELCKGLVLRYGKCYSGGVLLTGVNPNTKKEYLKGTLVTGKSKINTGQYLFKGELFSGILIEGNSNATIVKNGVKSKEIIDIKLLQDLNASIPDGEKDIQKVKHKFYSAESFAPIFDQYGFNI